MNVTNTDTNNKKHTHGAIAKKNSFHVLTLSLEVHVIIKKTREISTFSLS
jgi:hypothetical protein